MNTELKKTLGFVVVAVVLVGTTALATRPRVSSPEAFQDQGEPFFPEFTDPQSAAALEVIDYDPGTASAIPFKVEYQKDKGWVIPSHHDYPADAKDRLAKTAAGVIDLKKDVFWTDRADLHEELGVLDPLDTKTTSLQGRGKRVTIKDPAGKVLADFIIGKAVPGRTGQRFVRVPGQKRVYGVNVNVDLAARFGDWIETNLLKLDTSRVQRVTIDNHKVDPEQGTITPGDIVTVERKPPSNTWTMEGIPPDQELDTAKVSSLTSALADLKIVGVRPKPAGLTKELKAAAEGESGGVKLSRQSIASLASRGFYMTRDGRLVSNQGDVYVATDEGILYLLRFGEVTVATGDALTAGTDEDEAAKKSEDATKKAATGTSESRYLFVTAQFEPSLIPKPDSLTKPAESGTPELPEHVFERTPAEAKADEAKEKLDREDYQRKLTDGQKKAQELTDRFAAWYYVVPGDAFRNIVLNKQALLKPKGPATSPTGASLPPGLNLPGGLNAASPPAPDDHDEPDGPPPIP
jgi:hypothetical protein